MTKVQTISEILSEASETHHGVYKLVEGNDPDWASWYSEWLINLSKLPEILGVKPVKSELTYMLVKLDKDYTAENLPARPAGGPAGRQEPQEKWQDYYAKKLLEHFQKSS